MFNARDISRKAGINSTKFSLWDCGHPYRYLTPDEVQKVADVIGIDAATIADDKGRALFVE